MALPNVLLLSLILISTVSVIALAEPDCVYTFYLQTGTKSGAGTDSVISAVISDQTGDHIEIKNLERWGGLMEQGHDYYENGNLDMFSAKARCLPTPLCLLTLSSDGSGDAPGWYVNYVEVTTVRVGGQCLRQHFGVDQWLALDESPYDLTVVRNNCPAKMSVHVGLSGVTTGISVPLIRMNQ